LLRQPTALVEAAHLLTFLLGGLLGGALEILLISLASTYAPAAAQGRLFAGISLVKLGGSISGNLVGAAQFQASLDSIDGPYVLRGGAKPLTLLALPSLLVVVALTSVLPARSATPSRLTPVVMDVASEAESCESLDADSGSERAKRHDR